MQNLLLVALAVASISFTVSITSIMKPVRELISKWHPKFEEWIHCPYCFGTWVTFGILILVPYPSVTPFLLTDYLICSFAVMTIVACFHYIMLQAYKPVQEQMKFRAQQKAIEAARVQQ